jgi:hypothetical protein
MEVEVEVQTKREAINIMDTWAPYRQKKPTLEEQIMSGKLLTASSFTQTQGLSPPNIPTLELQVEWIWLVPSVQKWCTGLKCVCEQELRSIDSPGVKSMPHHFPPMWWERIYITSPSIPAQDWVLDTEVTSQALTAQAIHTDARPVSHFCFIWNTICHERTHLQ